LRALRLPSGPPKWDAPIDAARLAPIGGPPMRMIGIAALLMLLLARPALAVDRCLQGTSELGDQRALAELKSAIDETCLCTGASSRTSYRSCAGGVRDAALKAGILREACRAEATSSYTDSTCGSHLIA